MATDISSIKTLQDVINVLSVVYFNMNEIERIYYDMFINPVPMDITFQRYNDQGVLENITLPNRAKDHQDTLTGQGAPEGIVSADIGVLYLDTTSQDLYFKSVGTDAYGWLKIFSSLNLVPDTDFLKPDGDGSQLTNLNMSNAGSGVLAVGRGGTGATNITGIVKGNGSSAYTAAVDGVDYLGPASLAGIIAFYPIDNIPVGWLRCDGSAYSRTTYARLFNIIGTTYGTGDGSTTFNVPNLYDYFIRCWDGSRPFNVAQEDQVGVHTHAFAGETGVESAHTHTRGSMNITGKIDASRQGYNSESFGETYPNEITGAFEGIFGQQSATVDSGGGQMLRGFTFDASRSWTGATSAGSPHSHTLSGDTAPNVTEEGIETRVLNKALVPVIKY
jgi:microcystin-dependent protein